MSCWDGAGDPTGIEPEASIRNPKSVIAPSRSCAEKALTGQFHARTVQTTLRLATLRLATLRLEGFGTATRQHSADYGR